MAAPVAWAINEVRDRDSHIDTAGFRERWTYSRTPTRLSHIDILSYRRINKKREVVKQQTVFAAFLSDVKWTGGRVVARSRTPRVRCEIDVYCFIFWREYEYCLRDCTTTSVFGCRRRLCLVHVFYMTLALTSLAVISLIAHSPVGARVINYVFGTKKGD